MSAHSTTLLDGKVAVIVGAGTGLSRASALLMAEAGADIVLAARRAEVLQTVARDVETRGRRVLCVPTDVSQPEECRRLADRSNEAFGRIDILVVTSFYMGEPAPIVAADFADWRKVMDVNLFGALAVVRTLVPHLRESGNGRIILVNSTQAWNPEPCMAAYAASKAALASVTRSLAVELAPMGIRVNAMHPGLIMADDVKAYVAGMGDARGLSYEEMYKVMTAGEYRLGYIPGPEEIAGTVLYLASDLSRPVTGQSIGVNCGAWFH
ncbi:hypothetical protein ACG33_12595 [Steroidobacter denitrificans]|uniref:Short-chain dehydrogenase n=1 Tax=Steroidobacter denitrificans TaxID=465721 RepID=A0A127FDY6_STEDE|nr:SDR family oxidoreductase [Steroidobacter denitrificans]AMN47921.1 hypothetical protein ACG33_12595 [Steroidobacter denitrificans]